MLVIVLEIKDMNENRECEYSEAFMAVQLFVLLLLVVYFLRVAIWKPKNLGKIIECVHSRDHVLYRGAEKGLHAELWIIFPNTVAKDLLALIFFCFWHLIFLFTLVCLFKVKPIPMSTVLIWKNDFLGLFLPAKHHLYDYSI